MTADPRGDPSQEVVDASWEPADMPAIGTAVHFYTREGREQWRSVGEGPYAAIVTAHGNGEGRLGLYVLPAIDIQIPRFYADVPPVGSLRWWQPMP